MAELRDIACEYLVYGASGFFGQWIVKVLNDAGKKFVCGKARLEDRSQIEQELIVYQPSYVISAAGLAGTPNIDWFETNAQQGIRANVLGALNLVDLCYTHNIHVTTFGTGFLYNYDDAHPIHSGIGFSEKDAPNYTKGVYVETRLLLERLLHHYPNCLNLRPVFPITSLDHPKNLLSKLISFKKIVAIPTSISVMDDLWPLVIPLCEKKVTGTYNFTNPGVIDNEEIMRLYQLHVDPAHTWQVATQEEVQQIMASGRPAAELNVDKLQSIFPHIDHVHDAVEKMMKKIVSIRQSQASFTISDI